MNSQVSSTKTQIPKRILPIIVLSQFCCTSLWFASNGVIADMAMAFQFSDSSLSHMTSAVQFGFIGGTLLFAIFNITDRFSPSKVFLICAIIGALFNACAIWEGNSLFSLLTIRFFTGFFLAGIYPVGMKIASDYYNKGLGKSLGFLVGALVLGTAFPHLLKVLNGSLPWKTVILTTSCLAMMGGLLMILFVPNGPYRKPSQRVNLSAFFKVFLNKKFRASAFGYFGHMWELYAFWAFVPVILTAYNDAHAQSEFNISSLAFLIIGVGSLSCIFGGYVSQIFGTKKTAFASLLLSCICCLLLPLAFTISEQYIFITFMMLWGMAVIADSPLFSTLVAQNAPAEIKGTALTIVNCIGFAITIVSIQLVNAMQSLSGSITIYILLAIGPVLGLIALSRKAK